MEKLSPRKARKAIVQVSSMGFATVNEELNAHLAVYGLKPAAAISFSSPREEVAEKARKSGMAFEFSNRSGPLVHLNENLFLAVSADALSKAVSARTDFEYGIALGYPEDAVLAYTQTLGLGIRFEEDKLKAVRSGVGLPPELAYISHVPAQFDLQNGMIAKSSMEQGTSYREFMMSTNPPLSMRIELNYIEAAYDQAVHWDGHIATHEELVQYAQLNALHRAQRS